MEDPIAVAGPEIGAPPIQDRIQLPNHLADRRATGKRSDHFAYPIPDMLTRLLAWPHVQHPSGCVTLPSSRTPAFNQARIRRTTLLSPIRRSTNSKSSSCEIVSK